MPNISGDEYKKSIRLSECFLALRFVLAGLPLVFAAPASAQGEARLLFVNVNTGHWVVGGVDELGQLHLANGGTSPYFVNKTDLVATASYMLSYSASDGTTMIVGGVNNGQIAPVNTAYKFSTGWTALQSIGNYIFLYGADFGKAAAIVRTDPEDLLGQTFGANNFSQWSNVITTDNYILFYYNVNGALVTGHIGVGGGFAQTQSITVSPAYTLAASVGDDVLLYNRVSGYWESGSILYTGLHGTDGYHQGNISTSPTLGLGYSAAVQLNGHLMLYDSATGGAAVGHFNRGGHFALDQKTTIQKYFTHVIRCGQYIFLYGYGTGLGQVATISPTGALSIVFSATLTAGFWNVAATRN
jgi:hypothetical protein